MRRRRNATEEAVREGRRLSGETQANLQSLRVLAGRLNETALAMTGAADRVKGDEK